MKTISQEDLKKLHEVQVEILKDIDKFCQEHNITYFLIAGTLLGAIRHKGFIPWDDDIDIGMLRSDYEKFIKSYPSDKNNKYFVQTLETDPNYWHSYAKIRKKNTFMNEAKIASLNLNKEIFVDLFPFDNVKDGGYDKIKYRANIIKVIRESIYVKRKIITLRDCRIKFLSAIFFIFPVKTLYKFQKKLMMKYDKIETTNVACYIGEYQTRNEYLKKDVFLPVKKQEFEGEMFNAINKPEVYLEQIYGDYMKLPPKEKRVAHGVLEISLDTTKEK